MKIKKHSLRLTNEAAPQCFQRITWDNEYHGEITMTVRSTADAPEQLQVIETRGFQMYDMGGYNLRAEVRYAWEFMKAEADEAFIAHWEADAEMDATFEGQDQPKR
jgi:hypothetical protein